MENLAADRAPRAACNLLVFSDDWGRHPSSCQHLVRQLLPRYRVYWVNTIGMRRPALDRVTFRRGLEKLRIWLGPGRSASSRAAETQSPAANPLVLNPLMWPWFRRKHDRWLNRRLLCRQLLPVLRQCCQPIVAITTIPIVAELCGRLPVQRWVYYCVDDFSKWPGMDGEVLDLLEEQLVRRADVVVAASDQLQQKLCRWGTEAHLLTHGVDLEIWQSPQSHNDCPQLEAVERPVIMFFGSVDWRIDPRFVRELCSSLSQGTVVLLGPLCDCDSELLALPRVTHVPPVAYEKLCNVVQQAAVLIMPYKNGPGLQELQPLKLKEYLATGKPAVVRDLPATRLWADALDLASTPQEFAAAVLRRLNTGLPPEQAAARTRLASETWTEKARQFEALALASLPES